VPTSRRAAAAAVCGSRVEEGGNRDDIARRITRRSISDGVSLYSLTHAHEYAVITTRKFCHYGKIIDEDL